MKSFKYACQKYLTKDENELLSYDQKIELLNLTVKQQVSNWKYERATSTKEIDNTGEVDYTGIGEVLDNLPMTPRQRLIARYRYQRYTIDEIAELINVSHRTIDTEIVLIKQIMNDNRADMVTVHDTWHKKTSGHYDE